jgi:transcriptional regulator with XRE-family HTH domain
MVFCVIDTGSGRLSFLDKLYPDHLRRVQAENKEKQDKLDAFAHRLGQLAGRRKLKQKQIAIMLGATPQRVGGWFRAQNYPGTGVDHELAALLGVDRDWLIDGKENKESGLAEASIPYFASRPTVVAAEIRAQIEDLIQKTMAQPERLTWLQEQMKAHLQVPHHWRDEELGRRKLAELKARAAADSQTAAPTQERKIS